MTYNLFHKYKRYDVNEETRIEKNKTIQKHKEEIKNNGFVWWGVIQEKQEKKPRAPIGEENFKLLSNQIQNEIDTKVYFVESKKSIKTNEKREAYCATLNQIENFQIPELHKNCPDYYNNLKNSESRLWLRLGTLEKINLNDSSLKNLFFASSVSGLPFIEEIDINQSTLRLLKQI
jgi:hypothetical protein